MFVMYQNVLGGQPKIIFSKNCKKKKRPLPRAQGGFLR